MKKNLLILTLIITLFSCSKKENRPTVDVSYLGTYNSATDTAIITENGSYLSIEYHEFRNNIPLIFDSVVLSGSSFSVNQQIDFYSSQALAVGIGSFGSNTVNFDFVYYGNRHAKFNGVKKQ
jgi:hypothetical protein